MADCALTLNIDDPNNDPVKNGAIGVALAEPAVVGGGKIIAAEKLYELSDPYNVENFVRGQLYRWREYKPKGQAFYAYVPNTPTALYSDLDPVIPLPPAPGFFGDAVVDEVISNPASDSYATLEQFVIDHPGPQGNPGTPGTPGAPGAAGGTDAATASWIASGPLTVAALLDYKLKGWYAAAANRANRQVNVGLLAASLGEGVKVNEFLMTAPQRLAKQLNEIYFPTPNLTTHGRGLIGVPTAPMKPSPAVADGWPTQFIGGGFDDVTFGLGHKHRIWFSPTLGDLVKHTTHLTDPVTSCFLHHYKGPSGDPLGAAWKVNGGAVTYFSTYNATVIPAVETIGALAAASVIDVGPVVSGKAFLYSAVRENNGDENKGIQVHNLGHASWSAAQWALPGLYDLWGSSIAALNLDLAILQDFGVNDGFTGNGNKSKAAFKTDLIALIAKLRAKGVTCPILLVAVFDTTDVFPMQAGSWQPYVDAQREIAAADPTVAFFDHNARIPAHTSANPYALFASGADPHSNPNGSLYMGMADNLARAIAPR